MRMKMGTRSHTLCGSRGILRTAPALPHFGTAGRLRSRVGPYGMLLGEHVADKSKLLRKSDRRLWRFWTRHRPYLPSPTIARVFKVLIALI
jgi:hypothetical protein